MICADRWWSMMMYDDAMMYDNVWQWLMMYDDLHRKDWWKKRLWFCCVARRWWKFRFWTPQISTESIEDFAIIWKKWHVMSNCFYLRNIRACHIAITLCHVPSNHIIMSHPYHRLMTWGSLGTYQGGLRWLQNVEGHMPRLTEPRRTEKPWLFVVAEKNHDERPWSERIMHWIGFFLYYGWFSYSRELSQWRILLKKIYEKHHWFCCAYVWRTNSSSEVHG